MNLRLLGLSLYLLVFMATPNTLMADDDILVNTSGPVTNLNFGGRVTDAISPVQPEVGPEGYVLAKDQFNNAYLRYGNTWVMSGAYLGFDGTLHWARVAIATPVVSPPIGHAKGLPNLKLVK